MMIDKEKRYFSGWWLWVVLLIAISVPVFWALGAVGIIGKTVTERVVFEQSFQKKAGDSAKLSIFRAQQASLRSQLNRSDLTSGQRADFEAQLSAVNLQISTIEGN